MSGSEMRALSGFHRISHRGVGELLISQGETERVEIEAPDYIRHRIKTEVDDGTLILSIDRNAWMDWLGWFHGFFSGIGPVRFHVTVRQLTGVALSGAGNIRGRGVKSGHLAVVLRGAGQIRLEDIQVNELEVKLHSVGNIFLSGKADTQLIKLSGAGNYEGFALDSREARIRLSGLGNAQVWVRELLEGEINALGNIEYYGSPQVTRRVNGLGSFTHRGRKE